jgi:hypothetical protein
MFLTFDNSKVRNIVDQFSTFRKVKRVNPLSLSLCFLMLVPNFKIWELGELDKKSTSTGKYTRISTKGNESYSKMILILDQL